MKDSETVRKLAARPCAPAHAKASPGQQGGGVIDHRNSTAQLMRLDASIHASSKMVAQARSSERINQSAPVVQRYAVGVPQAGDKLSINGKLLLRGDKALYAAAEQFDQGNALQGAIAFTPGAPAPQLNHLHLVIPRYKISDAGPAQEAAESWARKDDDAAEIAEFDEERYGEDTETATLLDSIVEKIEDDWDTIPAEERTREFGAEEFDEDTVRDLVAPWLQLLLDIFPVPAYGNSRIAANFQAYLQRQAENDAHILLPSDCGKAAELILGGAFNSQKDSQSGATLSYSPDLAKRASWEWPHHFAAVIMHDGTDYATLENAAARTSEGFGRKLPVDKTWSFKLYGTQQGQSFMEHYAKDFGD